MRRRGARVGIGAPRRHARRHARFAERRGAVLRRALRAAEELRATPRWLARYSRAADSLASAAPRHAT
eukprot:3603213-Pyramimonas_sp.AAC.1